MNKQREDWWWVNKDSAHFIRGYLRNEETVQERVRFMADTAGKILKDPSFSDRFYKYVARGYYSIASPVWANFGRKGLPISCNNVYVEDSIASILTKQSEVGMQTKHGAGTSAFLGEIRPRGSDISGGDGKADGPVHFANLLETMTDIISQGSTRRGACAVYLPVEHPDILEFLEIRENGHPIQNLSIGVTITDDWMESMVSGDSDKRKIWGRIIKKRYERGYPYLFFHDNANRQAPPWYKGKTIWSSNLCTEIMLPSTPEESFVCDLSSLNLLMYPEWESTDAVETMIHFLDAVMEEYIEKTKDIPYMEPANLFAVRHRALGLGVLGWHSLLQSSSISFESVEALNLNKAIFALIEERAKLASRGLAERLGEPEVLKGTGYRNTTVMAIAPTKSSSFILGQVSEGVEPIRDNYHTKNLAKGKYTYKNPWLKACLDRHGRNSEDTWRSILERGGSVQHLEWLSDHERNVFKTMGEISQISIIQQAADRQLHIDQGQSVNVMIHPDTPPKETSQLLITAWQLGLKSLYYQLSTNKAQELARNLLVCESCSA